MRLARATLLPLMAACTAPLSIAAPDAAPKPNVILILADDLGYGDVGCYGQDKIRTPHLDRMASQGIRFTQFYAGSTVCAPSRSVLMTGLHMGHTRVRGNSQKPGAQELRDDDVTVAEVLKQAGYATGLVGKWGLGEVGSEGHPNRQGFDHFFGFLNQTHAHNHYPDHLWRNTEKVPLPNDLVQVGPVPGAGYATKPAAYADDLFFDEAAAFIEKHRDGPFFLELSLTVPHANNERSRALGDGQEVPDYGRFADEPWPAPLRGQAAMIERMDSRIGALFEQLRQLGIDDRTLVIFTSDNGPHNEGGPEFNPDFFDANGPLRGIKRDLTDGGIRVPFIVRWPGRIAPGSTATHVGYFGDMMATFAELAGAAPPARLDSISIVPTLVARGEQPGHESLYWEFYESGVDQAVLLDGRWKGLRLEGTASPIQLFDLANDISEETDVAAAHPEIVARIEKILAGAHEPNEHWRIEFERT